MKRYTLVTVLLVSSMSFVGCMAGGDWSGEPSELTTDGNFVNLSGKTKTTGLKTSLAPKHGTLTSKSSQKLGQTLNVSRKTTLAKGAAMLGQWSGTFTSELDGRETKVSVRFSMLKKLSFVAPKKTKKSFWQRFSLIRSAHACGPYGGSLDYQAISVWENLPSYVPSANDAKGNISTIDRFQQSASVRMQWGASEDSTIVFSAYLHKDMKTNKFELRGNISRLFKEVVVMNGKRTMFKMFGKLVLTPVQPSTPQ